MAWEMTQSGEPTTEGQKLFALIKRLKTHKVTRWVDGGSQSSSSGDGCHEAPLHESNIVSSHLRQRSLDDRSRGSLRHVVVLDIDHPTYVVRSTTPGHYHLYIDVAGGIPDDLYWPMIAAMANAGVVEPGYDRTSKARGFTAVRLPWVKKADDQVSGNPAPADDTNDLPRF